MELRKRPLFIGQRAISPWQEQNHQLSIGRPRHSSDPPSRQLRKTRHPSSKTNNLDRLATHLFGGGAETLVGCSTSCHCPR